MSFQQMTEQRELLGWCEARQTARHAGQPLPTLDQYRLEVDSGAWFTRVKNIWDSWSWYLRTQRRFAVADRNYVSAAAFGIASAIVAPGRAVRRAVSHKSTPSGADDERAAGKLESR